jgi:hypothetical protein
MKDKKWSLIVISLLILTTLNISGETKKLTEIGRYKFIPLKAGMPTPEMLKIIAEKYADDIKSGFDLAGSPDLCLPFIDRLKQSAYTERQLAVGDKMLWMIFRSGGKIKVVYDLEWAGREPLPVCSFSIVMDGKKYELIIPIACGNISLQSVEPVPGQVQESKPPQVPSVPPKEEERYQISAAKIYQKVYNLINDVDLYCSFSVWEDNIPELKVIGAERESEKAMYSDGDVIYLNKGKDAGIEAGQIFLTLEIKDELPGFGPLAFKKGRARVQFTTPTTSVAVVEHSCNDIRRGHYLVPFEAREGMVGRDLGYDVPPVEVDGVKGKLIYLQGTLRQIGSGQWALIDLGAEDGIQAGQQLILYRRARPDDPVQILGNCVVTDIKSRSSTIKVLSCRDAIRKGDLVMERAR